ncbi:MAG: four-carbon acid sugar kinase family protein [Tissierellia bacterium]|nr:four-carbon acid sugar kinase family protein [Tissierellia bacterium]
MAKILMVADDLTGANANCALMKKIGLTAASFLGNSIKELDNNIDAIALTTDSRAMDSTNAKKSIIKKLNIFKDEKITIYSKRIDSTLRGNLGGELETYQTFFKRKRIAICAAAFPDSNRIVVDGKLYVNGSLLLNTDAGNDPKMPVVSNYVSENFKKDYNGKILNVYLEDVEKGIDHIKKLLIENQNNYDLIIFDSITNNHLNTIAKAVIDSNIEFISVDPGPFTTYLTSLLYKNNKIATKALAVIGSVTKTTIAQLNFLKQNYNCYLLYIDPINFLSIEGLEKRIEDYVFEVEKNIEKHDLIIITTTPKDINDRLDLFAISKTKRISVDDISIIISRALANIAKKILVNNKSFAGVFSSGGDITVALSEELLSLGIEIKDEIVPLAAYGRFLGGLIPNLKVVSKGGMVGDENTMIKCIEKILKLED